MNCVNHPGALAVAYCRTCGKPLCNVCTREVQGVVYCEECLAAHVNGTIPPPGVIVPPAPAPGSGSPTLAAVLGCIPGVGAMYNGEYAKGFIHVLIFATLIWMSDHVNDVFGLGVMAFYIYMPIEAYKTARARQRGLPAPDPLGFNNLFGSGPSPSAARPQAPGPPPMNSAPIAPPGEGMIDAGNTAPLMEPEDCKSPSRVPLGAVILIGLGVLFLLDEMGALHFDWIWRFWPLILIAIGVRILMQRQRRGW
jgi:TM2 domain-containing membrane protein YozV